MDVNRYPVVPVIERISDGRLFRRNADGTYSMDGTMMDPPYRWTYPTLMNDDDFRVWKGIDHSKSQ